MIRRITRADIEPTLQVWRASCLAAHPFLSSKFLHACEEIMRESTLLEFETDVFEEGEIRAFISRMDTYVDALFVDPRFQGQGLGKRLLDHAKAQSSLLRLSVFAQNPRAVKFYQREGFWATDVKGHGETEETIVLLRWEAPRVPVK